MKTSTNLRKGETLLQYVKRRIDEIRDRESSPEHIQHWNDLITIKDELEAMFIPKTNHR